MSPEDLIRRLDAKVCEQEGRIAALTELVAKLGDRLCACAEILGRLAEKRNGGEK